MEILNCPFEPLGLGCLVVFTVRKEKYVVVKSHPLKNRFFVSAFLLVWWCVWFFFLGVLLIRVYFINSLVELLENVMYISKDKLWNM